MKLLDKLERNYGQLAIPNLTYYLVIGNIIAYSISLLQPQPISPFILQGQLLFKGEFWRLGSWIFTPISADLIFAALTWYFLYLMGTGLESHWKSFRYNLFLLTSYLMGVALSLVFPSITFSSGHIFTPVFLAFAYLYPNFTLYLFFIIPVKIKWLALISWIGFGAAILFGDWPTRITTLTLVSNFFIFFWPQLTTSAYLRMRGMKRTTHQTLEKAIVYHTCAVCGSNEVKDPDMKILYCKECIPSTCYCASHIDSHTHKKIN